MVSIYGSYRRPSHLVSFTFSQKVDLDLKKLGSRGILLDAHFASFFLAKLTKRSGYLDDLASLDASLYKGLLYLKNCDEPEALSLYFAVASEEFGQIVTEDLVENGSNLPVTKANRLQYITLLCNYRLNKQSELQSKAFISGLQNILQPSWLRMFSHREISILLGLKSTTQYLCR